MLPPGASSKQIDELESRLQVLFPRALRQFMRLTNGAGFFDGIVRFFSTSEFIKSNKEIRGGWFGTDALFFAEGSWRSGADLFFFELTSLALDDPPVRAFSGDPTFICDAAPSFSKWLDFVCEHKGRAVSDKVPSSVADPDLSVDGRSRS